MGVKANRQMTGTDGHERRLLSLEKNPTRWLPRGQRGQSLSEFITVQDLVLDPELLSDHTLLTHRNIHSNKIHLKN